MLFYAIIQKDNFLNDIEGKNRKVYIGLMSYNIIWRNIKGVEKGKGK